MRVITAISLMLLCNTNLGTSQIYKRYVSPGSDAGAYNGADVGTDTYGYPTPPLDFPGFINPLGFHNVLDGYLMQLQKQQALTASQTSATDNASAQASTLLYPDNLFRQQFEHQKQLLNSIGQQADTTYGAYPDNFASAGASYGPQGIYQSAYINPPNPNRPNINTRFASSGGGSPGNSFYGVSTSSFSESSDVNGRKSSRRGAYTQVNDNGKITTYQTYS